MRVLRARDSGCAADFPTATWPRATRTASRCAGTSSARTKQLDIGKEDFRDAVHPCVLTPEDEGGFFVSFPDVPEALTGGDNRAEALEMAEEALAAAFGIYVREREDIPVPSAAIAGQALVVVPAVVAAKLALYTAVRRQGITKVALAEPWA